MKKKIKIGTLISGSGTNLQAIIDNCASGKIDGEIMFTCSDVPNVKGLERAQKAGIDTFIVDYKQIIKKIRENPSSLILPDDFNIQDIMAKQNLINNQNLISKQKMVSKQSLINKDKELEKIELNKIELEKIEFFFKSRAIAEKMLLDHILPYKIDLLVLAGFMHTLTPYFIDRINIIPNKGSTASYKYRIMNIHPALLPAFPGIDGYGDTFRYGCKIGGCTVHYIDYGEDTGPIIGQRAFQIEDGDTLEMVKQKGLALEWELYPECIQKFAMDLTVTRCSSF